ncbi:MAG: L-threonylcarbamoyladenylate synthase [Phycisphaerales bacterium]
MTAAGPEEIALAVDRLRRGLLVAFPTETVYGLGADALSSAAVERVFALKGRPANNPLIVHVSGIAMARRVVASWPADAETLARRFWPGPLTLVLPKSACVPAAVTASGPNVAVRCPEHHLTLALLEAFGKPLVGPSANPSGFVSPTTAEHVRGAFDSESVFVLDGGPCSVGIESTVLSLATPEPTVLRPGMVSADELAGALGRHVHAAPHAPAATSAGIADAEAGGATEPMPSPGLLPSHYAPRTRAILVTPAELSARLGATARAVLLTHTGLRAPPPHTVIDLPSLAPDYAARLYAALRDADTAGALVILIERPETAGHAWDAIRDRLRRATAKRS